MELSLALIARLALLAMLIKFLCSESMTAFPTLNCFAHFSLIMHPCSISG